MILEKIELRNFRNYSKATINLSDNINILYGKNAQGKTNILEAIYVLGFTKTHNSILDTNLIKNGEKYCSIKGTLKNKNIKNELEVSYYENIKKIKIDNNQIKKVSDYISKLNVISFYPEDLDIVKGSPIVRRNFLNLELSQLYGSYYKVLSDYNKLLKIRNEYLKKLSSNIDIDNNYFDIITEYLIEKSIFIYKMRYKFIEKLNNNVNKIFKRLTNIENFNIKYVTNYEVMDDNLFKEKMKELYKKSLQKEIKNGSTLIGPHRDDLEFYINDDNIKSLGSQGQKRMALLSLKLAEIEIFKKYAKTNPILLLDDVFSELDITKRNKLLTYINKNIQTIITTTDLKNLSEKLINNGKIFYIKEGNIVKEK